MLAVGELRKISLCLWQLPALAPNRTFRRRQFRWSSEQTHPISCAKSAPGRVAAIRRQRPVTTPQLPVSYLLLRNYVTTITAWLGIYLDN
jgi:hypothetical protein